MYIRRTKTKTLDGGGGYYTYRIVESVRVDGRVQQRTLLNLGKDFPVPEEHWSVLAKRIEQIMQQPGYRQAELFRLSDELGQQLESAAQHYYASRILRKLSCRTTDPAKAGAQELEEGEYYTVDINHLEAFDPRSIGVEILVYFTWMQFGLGEKLRAFGFNGIDHAAAIGNIIGRAVSPGSELHTYGWLREHSASGEIIDYDYHNLALTRLYEVTDKLFKHRKEIETFPAHREQDLFNLSRCVVLYDSTNTYFEGTCQWNSKARYGRSKEKRNDCLLVTLGLVLDGNGFPPASEVFAGDAGEPQTLETMLTHLEKGESSRRRKGIVVMDAGIASNENVEWLKSHQYHYLVVSRAKHEEDPRDSHESLLARDDPQNKVTVLKRICADTGETRLYCHSELKEKKEQSIRTRFHDRFEQALQHLNDGLKKKGSLKSYEKVVEKIGRLREKNRIASLDYSITVIPDENKKQATEVVWQRNEKSDQQDRSCGIYCLRTNIVDWSEQQLWETYITLTEIESTFRSLKSELGLRPVYHQKEDRVSAHLFITVLAYHLVHTIRYQLKQHNIHPSWNSIRKIMATQQRIRVSMPTNENQMIHLRPTTKPEAEQKIIYRALNISADPIGTHKTILDNVKSVVPTHAA